MHSDTMKLALCAEHENAKCHRVHVTFLNGKRVAIATDMKRVHVEPSESSEAGVSPLPGLSKFLVPESGRRALTPPDLAAVLHAERLGEKCRETALVAIGGLPLNAHYVADALRHVGAVGACYVKADLDASPVTFESAEHPGRWACIMPCMCHSDDVERYCADNLKTLECVAARIESAVESDDEDDEDESLFDIIRERDFLRRKVENEAPAWAELTDAVAAAALKRKELEAQLTKLREALKLIANGGPENSGHPSPWEIARTALAASPDASGITDTQRLSVCEHMGWTKQTDKARSLKRLVRLRHANDEAHPTMCSKCGELEKTGRGKDRRCLWCNWPCPENTELPVGIKDALAEALNISGSTVQPNNQAHPTGERNGDKNGN